MRIRREVVGALCAILVTACAAQAAGPGDDGSVDVSHTIPLVGVLPEPLPTASGVAIESTDPGTSSTPATTSPATTTTGLHAEGNRVLLIGDSILASTAKRYSNDMCTALVPLGWQVEVEAEVSRGIVFGNEVLAARKSAGWDVGVVFLGSNDGGNSPEYLKNLNKIITTFAPSPVVLITMSEFKPEMEGINDTIRAIAEVYPDRVSVIDWTSISKAPGVVNEDGIHLTTDGRKVLAAAVADHLGTAPTSPGDCLASTFHDDSAGSVTGGANPGTTVKPGKPTTTPTTTTVKPGTGGGTSTTLAGGSSTTTPTGPSTTVAGTTATTAAPPTSAPTATTAPPPSSVLGP
jgi:lysophospholipase L1-like esterase